MEEIYVPNRLIRNFLRLHCVGFHLNVPRSIASHHPLDLSWRQDIKRCCKNFASLETPKRQFW